MVKVAQTLQGKSHWMFEIVDEVLDEGDFSSAIDEAMVHRVAQRQDESRNDFIIHDPRHLASAAYG